MIVLRVRNVHEALPVGVKLLWQVGDRRKSRAGEVVVAPEPVTTVYDQPLERVIFHEKRDANPFFHLMESLWMLGGREDVEFVSRYVKRMKTFSDDGEIFNGAYGSRWRWRFDYDQIQVIIDKLRKDPNDRRVVLGIWDSWIDLKYEGKDTPCNTHIYFSITADDRLDMTVCNRSNDIVWGAYGANAVHLSVLHEYMSEQIGVKIGRYRQISNNYHAYVDVLEKQAHPAVNVFKGTPYEKEDYTHFPLGSGNPQWDLDLQNFFKWAMDNPSPREWATPFFEQVIQPMEMSHKFYKAKNFNEAMYWASTIKALDWRQACTEWLRRRQEAYNRVKDDGVEYGTGK